MTMNVILNILSRKTDIFSPSTSHDSMDLSVNVVPRAVYYQVQLSKSAS